MSQAAISPLAPRLTPSLRSEWKTTAAHAGTVYIGQLAVMAFSITDTIVTGRYSDQALAALSIASSIYISVYVSLMGVLQSLLPVYAELHGAKKHALLGLHVRQSLYLAVALIVVGMAVMLNPAPMLDWADVPPEIRPDIEMYMGILAWALIPLVGFRMYSSLNQALGKPLLVTWLQVGSLALKIPLTIWLCFGGAGVSPMGVVGCAWATFCVNWMMLGLAILMLRTQPLYTPLVLFKAMEGPDWPLIGRFARVGLPGGLAYLVEITSFTLMALFIARMGVLPSAAHQIASNVAGSMFMAPLSLGVAYSARCSYWIGAGQPHLATRVARMGIVTTVLWCCTIALLCALFATPIASLYSSNPAVVALGASLLVWTAVYHAADGTQTVCAFLLRSWYVTLTPLLVYAVLLWGVGLWGGYLLAYQGIGSIAAMHTPQAFWIAGTVAIAAVALVFLAIFARATRKTQAIYKK